MLGRFRNYSPDYSLNCTPLGPITITNFVSHSHSLGFTTDNQLNWGHHIKDLATSMAKKVKQLRRFKSLPSPILESIYYKGIA